MFGFSDCQGLSFFTTIPQAQAQDHVPTAFRPVGLAPGSAELGLTGFSCDRVAYGNQTFAGVYSLWTNMWVDPENDSWVPQDGNSFYSYDVMVNNQTLVAALADVGIPAVLAEFTHSNTPEAGAMAQQWAAASQDVSYMIAFENSLPRESVTDGTRFHWFDLGDRYQRVEIGFTFRDYQPGASAGSVTVTGASGFRQALGVDHASITGSGTWAMEWTIPSNHTIFQEEQQ